MEAGSILLLRFPPGAWTVYLCEGEMMENARMEFLEHTKDRRVKCAQIWTGGTWKDDHKKYYQLRQDYSPEGLSDFLNSLEFKYDDGYGTQNLFGFIWYEDGTWSSRGEYDGREWWEHNYLPPIPKELDPL